MKKKTGHIKQSIHWFLGRSSISNHFLLNFIWIGIVILLGMGDLCALHPLFALVLVFVLGWAFLLDILQIVYQILHLLFSCPFIWLDVVYHWVDSLLSLLELVFLGFLHVLFDSYRGYDSQMILNYIDIFINFWNFFVLIE